MKTLRYCLFFIYASSLLACTKGNPDFQAITEDTIPRPKLKTSNNTFEYTKSIFTNNKSATPTIEGICHPKITDIQATVVLASPRTSGLGGISSTGAALFNCSLDGTFSFSLQTLEQLGFTLAENTKYVVELRGISNLGTSKPSFIEITYSTRTGLVTSGGAVEVTGTGGFAVKHLRAGFKANEYIAPLTDAQQAHTKTDGVTGGFSAQIGVRVKSD